MQTGKHGLPQNSRGQFKRALRQKSPLSSPAKILQLSSYAFRKAQSIAVSKKRKARVTRADSDIVGLITYAEKEVPQPHPPVAFGFSKVNPDPIMFDV